MSSHKSYKSRSSAELRQLAMDIASGSVFTSGQVRETSQDMLGLIFMPLIFMSDERRKELTKAKIVMIYEYIREAGQRSINGYPIFMSCHMLDKTDAARVWELVREFDATAKAFLDPSMKSSKDRIDPNQTVLFQNQEEDKNSKY